MKLHRLTLSGVGPFRRTATLDLAALNGARLVALTGANGAGKSTALECLPGVLYRTLPTRGALATLATSRDSYAEAVVETPRGVLTVRQSADAVSWKAEAVVLDESGRTVLPSTSVRAYDAWAEEALPPLDVYLASLYAAQGSGGFLDLPMAERRGVVLRALGIARLEEMAARARERAAAKRQELAVLAGRIAQERESADVSGAEVRLCAAMTAEGRAQQDLARALAELEAARTSHAALVAAHDDARNARARAAAADARLVAAREALRAVSDRQEAAAAVLRGAADVTAAEERLVTLRAVLAEWDHRLDRAKEGMAAAAAERSRIEAEHAAAQRRYAEAMKAAEAAVGAANDLPRARAAVDEADALRGEAARADVLLRASEAEVERIRQATLDVAGRRIEGLRSGLVAIERIGPLRMDAERGPWQDAAAEALSADDDVARAATEAPGALARAREEATRHRSDLERHRIALRAAEGLAARLPDLERAAAAATEAADLRNRARVDLDALTDATKRERFACETAAMGVSSAEDGRRKCLAEIAAAEKVAARASEIAAARARAEELLPARAAAEAELDAAREHVRLCPEPPAEVPIPPDLSALEAGVRTAEEAVSVARGEAAKAAAALESARAAAARVATLDAQREGVERDMADLARLAEDLGQKGLIALEVDAAGPELSEIASSLLRECFGPRWTVTIATTRPKADGLGSVEVCDVSVLDTETGTDGPAERLSGGERVIVGEAVALALSTLAIRRAGLVGATLVRDESGAALDPERGRQYVTMLRRAAELVGAERVLLVSHSPEVQSLCDARVRVAGGEFVVEV